MLRPRQVRMSDTRLQQLLRTAHPSQRTAQVGSQLLTGLMHTVRQVPFPMSPYLLHRVQFRCVARESVDMQSWLCSQKLLDLCASMNLAAIPNDKDMPLQMPQQVTQKTNHFQPADIVGMKPRIKPESASSRGNGQDADDRYLVAPIAVAQDGGLANWCPCPTNVGNQEKSAFVEESQMGPKPFGFFLYAAKRAFSTGGSFPRHAATPSCPASGSSNSIQCVVTARPRPRYISRRIAWRSISRCASRSTARWNARLLRHPLATLSADHLFAPASNGSGVPIRHALSNPVPLSLDEPGSIEQRYSRTPLLLRLPCGRSFPSAAKPMPDTDATPTVCMFHMVSCQKYSMYPLLVKCQ